MPVGPAAGTTGEDRVAGASEWTEVLGVDEEWVTSVSVGLETMLDVLTVGDAVFFSARVTVDRRLTGALRRLLLMACRTACGCGALTANAAAAVRTASPFASINRS
jgi:hypothetical protein